MRFTGLFLMALFGVTLVGCNDDDGGSGPVILLIAPGSAVVDDDVTITGSRFGASEGEVRVGGVLAAVVSWSDGTIVITVPDVLPGSQGVVVSSSSGDSDPAALVILLPRAVYVSDDSSSVFGFLVDGAGALTALTGSPYATGGSSAGFGGDSDSIRVHAGTRRVFATNSNSVAVWDIDPVTAALTPVAGSPFALAGAGACYGIVVNAAGTRVFVADYDNGTVHVLAVDALGALTPVAGSPFTDGGASTDVAKLSIDGAFLYVNDETSNPSSVHVYAVDATGALTPIAGNPFDYPETDSYAFGIEMSPQGRLYVPDYNRDTLRVYDLAGDGTPTENVALRTAQADPNSLAFTRNGARLFASGHGTQLIHVYDVNVGNGTLTAVAGSPFTIASAAGLSSLVTDDTGSFLFAADENGPALIVLAVDGAGALTQVGAARPLTGEPSGIDFSR